MTAPPSHGGDRRLGRRVDRSGSTCCQRSAESVCRVGADAPPPGGRLRPCGPPVRRTPAPLPWRARRAPCLAWRQLAFSAATTVTHMEYPPHAHCTNGCQAPRRSNARRSALRLPAIAGGRGKGLLPRFQDFAQEHGMEGGALQAVGGASAPTRNRHAFPPMAPLALG